MTVQHTIEFRVRYDEADQMGVVHHSRYLTYFELGRVELMRAVGLDHLHQEERGQPLSIAGVEIKFLAPARYDDTLRLVTTIAEAHGARVVFQSRLSRVASSNSGRAAAPEPNAATRQPETPIAEATLTAAAVTADGRVRRLSAEELAAFGGTNK